LSPVTVEIATTACAVKGASSGTYWRNAGYSAVPVANAASERRAEGGGLRAIMVLNSTRNFTLNVIYYGTVRK
jgi:hypothetical protein